MESPRIVGPGAILYGDGDIGFSGIAEPVQILAQGDSWFSIGALPPFATTNLLMEMTFALPTCIVNCAHPGDTLAHMVNWRADPQFAVLVAGPRAWRWNAIFLSAGGNDLIDAIGVLPIDKFGDPVPPHRRLLLAR
ncbi:hypothetical protein E4K72_05525 [Oxalobacteraceae bacterium OM1]|nr:hypothetical protein E4K72_05525 [Oxalobacteraceae bacterium OM1]